MIVDLHSHYPMHLVPDDPGPLSVLTHPGAWHRWQDRTRALLVGLASRFANYRSFTSGPGVTVEKLRAGRVGVALSVLYSPFDEADPLRPFGAPPTDAYFPTLLRQLELVEERIAGHAGEARIVRSPDDLDDALAADELALLHVVEGGFHLGGSAESIAANVAELGRRGVGYVTLAHLLFRGIATNANALPFLSDRLYHLVFHQPKEGLTSLGEAAVRAMVAQGVLVDIAHMSERARADTFTLLDELDPERTVPVLATHIACRFGTLEYNLDDAALAAVSERGGALGVIACDHFARKDGRHRPPPTWEGTVQAICDQIDHVHEVTGSHDHAAIGTDLDGYIKPMLHGLDDASKLADLQSALVDHYGMTVADQVCSGNALRVLRAGWGKKSG